MKIEIEMYEPGRHVDVTNDERALMVEPLVMAFANAYYWGSESVEAVVQDLIADLGHYLDRGGITSDHIFRDDRDPWGERTAGFNQLVVKAVGDYEYECAEERMQATDTEEINS